MNSLFIPVVRFIAWCWSWWYTWFGDEYDLDIGQIMGDLGALYCPEISNIWGVRRYRLAVSVWARAKATSRINALSGEKR